MYLCQWRISIPGVQGRCYVDHDICLWRCQVIEDNIWPRWILNLSLGWTYLDCEGIIDLQLCKGCSPGLRYLWSVLNSLNANANAITKPIIVSVRKEMFPLVSRIELDDDPMLKADRQLIMLDDHDSETLPFHYDKFVYLFHDVLSFYKTVIQAELQSNYSFPSLFSLDSDLTTTNVCP